MTLAGAVNTIELNAGAAAGFPSGSATASVDPYIEIDPSFANASQYSLEFSDGVENTPEPSSFWLTPAACCALAALRRAQRAAT